MGVGCGLTSVLDETIARIKQHPPLLWRVLAPGDEKSYLDALERYNKNNTPGFICRLLGRKKQTHAGYQEYEPVGNECLDLSLDKAWHGIHYLLTGSESGGLWPGNFLLIGGEPVKDGDYDDRMITSSQVKEINQFLQKITKEEYESRYNPEKMIAEKIYPGIWSRSEEDGSDLSYITGYFLELKQYINTIAEKNMGVIIGVN